MEQQRSQNAWLIHGKTVSNFSDFTELYLLVIVAADPSLPLSVSRCWCPAALCAAAVTRWCMMRRSWPAGRRTTLTWTRPARSAAPPLSPFSTLRSVIWDLSAGTNVHHWAHICHNIVWMWLMSEAVRQFFHIRNRSFLTFGLDWTVTELRL